MKRHTWPCLYYRARWAKHLHERQMYALFQQDIKDIFQVNREPHVGLADVKKVLS